MPVNHPVLWSPAQVPLKDPAFPTLPLPAGPEVQTMSRELFDQLYLGQTPRHSRHASHAGHHPQLKRPQERPLGERLTRPRVGQRPAQEKSASAAGGEASAFDDDETEFPYRVAARGTLDSMLEDDSQRNREEIMQALARMPEPMQQFTVLFGAMKEVERRDDLAPDRKLELKHAFSEMMTDLVNRDRGGIRSALREGAEASPVAATIDAARVSRGMSGERHEIRFKIGARAPGGVDEQLTAMVMVKTLLKNVGPAYAEEAMDSVRTRLMQGLRSFSAVNGPAYMLTYSDATAFAMAKTSFHIAADLKRELVGAAGLLCRLHHVEVASVLLTAAEQGWGKGKAAHLVGQLVTLKQVEEAVAARACLAIRRAVQQLSSLAWPAERAASQKDLLEDLLLMVHKYHDHDTTTPLTKQAARKEKEWLSALAAAG
ncbi:hypothetical protein [Duganella radicis]|nr:hypothetical protein [Duganella radicis]